ncbi:MAG: hypothetical protein NC489_31765 [Ruminococcus flavefaciens]|nr:hypothetical protein [Ruminococcus flavefaciens]
MKQKTKQRLRRLSYPFVIIWVSVAVVIAVTGAVLISIGYYMLGDPTSAKNEIKELFR